MYHLRKFEQTGEKLLFRVFKDLIIGYRLLQQQSAADVVMVELS